MDRVGGEAVEEVVADCSRRHEARDGHFGRSDDTQVDVRVRSVGADVSSLTQDAEERGLRRRDKRLDLVEEEYATVGSRLVAARLVRVDDGEVLWANTYDRQMEDLFALQQELADLRLPLVLLETTGRPEARISAISG